MSNHEHTVSVKRLDGEEQTDVTPAEAEKLVAQGRAEFDLPRKPTTFGATIPPADTRPDPEEFDLSKIVVEQGINESPDVVRAAMQEAPERAVTRRARAAAAGRKGELPNPGPVRTDEDAEKAQNAPKIPGA